MGKLLSNAMLAQRISSINSMTGLCEKTGASISEVKGIIGSDSRIGSQFLQCSIGFGGSCFEKDLESLVYILDSNDEHEAAKYWQGVLDINFNQKKRLASQIQSELTQAMHAQSFQEKGVVTLFGFSYKKNTSDARTTQASFMVNYFARNGFEVRIHDPQVKEEGFLLEMEA
jgi:UDPglucose 6-dehydrogenase